MPLFGGKKPDDQSIPEINNPGSGDASEAGSDDAAGGLEQLTARLGSLQEMLHQTKSQVTEIIARHTDSAARSTDDRLDRIARRLDELNEKIGGVSPGAAGDESAGTSPDSQVLGTLLKKLEQLEESFRQGGGASDKGDKSAGESVGATADTAPLLEQLRDELSRQFDGVTNGVTQAQQQIQQHVNGGLNQICQHLDAKLSEIITILRPPQPESQEPASLGDDANWQLAVLGAELTADPSIEHYRRHLLEGIINGDDGARTFAGQLLVFRSARTDALPKMLRLLGEAFYCWLPKSTQDPNPMEQALVQWVNDYCFNAGIGNTIEIVTPGERFDTQRHTPTNRTGGVEIQCARGWIVVREGGRVYIKATVDVV